VDAGESRFLVRTQTGAVRLPVTRRNVCFQGEAALTALAISDDTVGCSIEFVAFGEDPAGDEGQVRARECSTDNRAPIGMFWRHGSEGLDVDRMLDGCPREVVARRAGENAIVRIRETHGRHETVTATVRGADHV
jgi:hypothetical protein